MALSSDEPRSLSAALSTSEVPELIQPPTMVAHDISLSSVYPRGRRSEMRDAGDAGFQRVEVQCFDPDCCPPRFFLVSAATWDDIFSLSGRQGSSRQLSETVWSHFDSSTLLLE